VFDAFGEVVPVPSGVNRRDPPYRGEFRFSRPERAIQIELSEDADYKTPAPLEVSISGI
jgi:hypothetical protein